MRGLRFVTLPALVVAIATPAVAQVSARVHVNIPVGRPAPVAVRGPAHRALSIRPYVSSRYGAWENYYQDWQPTTVYLYDGQYYDYPIYEYAEPLVVYRYRDELFFPPRDRGWVDFQARRPIYRDVRPEYRGGAAYRDSRPQVYAAPRANERGYGQPAPRGEVRGSYPRPEQGGQARGAEPQRGGADQGGRPQQQGRSGGSVNGGTGHGSQGGADRGGSTGTRARGGN